MAQLEDFRLGPDVFPFCRLDKALHEILLAPQALGGDGASLCLCVVLGGVFLLHVWRRYKRHEAVALFF